MEHFNKIAKVSIRGLGANKSERIGKAIGTVLKSLENFEEMTNIPSESSTHTASKGLVQDCERVSEGRSI